MIPIESKTPKNKGRNCLVGVFISFEKGYHNGPPVHWRAPAFNLT